MKVVIIGSGNAATVLGRLMSQNNVEVLQVMSRNIEHAATLADELNCKFSDYNGLPDVKADIYIIAVADTALTPHVEFIKNLNKPVAHTAGSVPKDVLKTISSQYGVFYPVQSLKKEMKIIPPVPILIDASDAFTLDLLQQLAAKISDQVQVANDEQRQKLHVAAVFVNNFTNHLYVIAESYCQKEGVDFNVLKPMIVETAVRMTELSPAKLQTGPAARNDLFTIEKHLSLLQNYPEWKELYVHLTNSIMDA
jgi:predicted short-subunit dehydrogenase-like oxidoreductase (DUF2520 family)